MPKVKHDSLWEINFREEVTSLSKGWNVREKRGKVFLRTRIDGNAATVYLPFPWAKEKKSDAFQRIRNIYNLTLEGHDLLSAAKIADGKAPKIERNWSQHLENFKRQKFEHGNAITEKTWEHDYAKVLKMAAHLLEGKDPPANPQDLIDLCVKDWETGSATRKRRTGNLCQFLTYCVQRENAPYVWLPPVDKKIHIGRKPANAKTQKKDPISDQEIVDLIDAISVTPAGKRWADVLRLWAVYGLRPGEVKYLHVRSDSLTGEPYLWCSYQKRSGGGVSPQRRLMPLPIAGYDWNLLPRLQANLIELPSLTSENGVGEVARKYLERRAAWNSLIAKLKARGEQLGTYSFRHSYSVRGHRLGIDQGSMAKAMGHTEEVHSRAYPWSTSESMVDAFEKALLIPDNKTHRNE